MVKYPLGVCLYMSQLRKEYKEFKQIQQENFMEAAELWTADNVIIINERLNRNAIYRLNTAIQRFDNKFGKYRDQLPAIADILDKAENGLHLVINGKIGSRSTAQMLQRMSIIYNILTNFFGGDLGALLKTPAFRVAHEQPDEKIDKIVDRGHNVKAIRRNLAAALKPSDEERTIFRRAYKSFEMPTLDWNMAAKQLCCLSCNELKDLTGVERVPMVVVDESDEEKSTDSGEGVVEVGAGAARAYGSATRTIGRAADAGAKYGIPLAGAAVGGVVTAAGAGITGIINRFKARSKEMTAAIDKLEKMVSGVEGFANIDKALGQLREKSKAAANSSFDPAAGVRGLLRHPSVVIMKQAVMATEAIEAVLKAWNEHIKTTYAKGINAEDLPKIKKELEKRVKGGVLTKIKGAISGVRAFPGLSPDDIINAVMAVAGNNIQGAAGGDGTATPPSGAGPAQGATPIIESYKIRFNDKNLQLESLHTFVSEMMLTEDYKDLEKLISQIGTFEKSASGKVEDEVTKELQSVQKTGTTPAAPKTPAAPQKGQPAKAPESTNVQPPTTPQQAVKAAQEITKEAEGTAEQDPGFELQDLNVLNTSIDVLNKSLSNPLNADLLKNVNAQIAALQVPGVSDYNSARDFINQYKSIITEPILQNTQNAVAMVMATINKYAEQPTGFIPEDQPLFSASNFTTAPRAAGATTQESKNKKANDRRQLLVEKIKQIILEQLEENQADAQTTEKLVQLYISNPAARRNPNALKTAAINAGLRMNVSKDLFNTVKKIAESKMASNQTQAAATPAAPAVAAPASAPTQATPQAATAQAVTAAPASTATPAAAAPQQQEVLSVVEVPQQQTVIIDDNVMNQFNSSIASLNNLETLTKLNVQAAINAKLSTIGIQNVTDLPSFQNYLKKYQSIMTNAKNIRKIMSIINKTAAVVSKTPAPAAPPATAAE